MFDPFDPQSLIHFVWENFLKQRSDKRVFTLLSKSCSGLVSSSLALFSMSFCCLFPSNTSSIALNMHFVKPIFCLLWPSESVNSKTFSTSLWCSNKYHFCFEILGLLNSNPFCWQFSADKRSVDTKPKTSLKNLLIGLSVL